jgi:AraC-like DNA-binding protein
MVIHLPSYSIKSLINFLRSQGLPRATLLQLIETDETELNDSKFSYPFLAYEQLISFASEALNVPNIGFEHGKAFELSCWGILGHIVVASKNLWDALTYQKKYQCLLGNTGQATYEIDDGAEIQTEPCVVMRWLSDQHCSPNAIEHVITAWTEFAFEAVQTNDTPISVHFTHPCLTQDSDYTEFFGCDVFFNANFNGIKIKQTSLESTLIGYNQEVLNVLCCHAENLLAEKRFSGSLDIVVQYIIETLPNHVPNLAEIAEHLGISSQQLQRKLKNEQTNLTLLLEEIRSQSAISYLTQTDHKLLYISTVLGYSEQSAFQRAFKRWHGMTPQNFRLNPKINKP